MLIAKQQTEGVPSKIKPRSSASLRRAIHELANEYNQKVPEERQVTQRDIDIVASRSLNNTTGMEKKSRFFAAYREVASFVSLAIHGKVPVHQTRHRDLLPIGHPLSTRPHAMTASAHSEALARWIAADPRIDDSARALVSSAFSYPMLSVEQRHAAARLTAVTAGLVPQDIIIAAQVDGDSETVFIDLGKSARAEAQRRDRKGRFAYEGGGLQFFVRVGNNIKSKVKQYIGNSSTSDGFQVEILDDPDIPDGLYDIPSKNAEAIKAFIPGIGDDEVDLPSDVDAMDISQFAPIDAPNGWTLVKEKQEGELGPDKVYENEDGYVVEYFEGGKYEQADVQKAYVHNGGIGSEAPGEFVGKFTERVDRDGNLSTKAKFNKDKPLYVLYRKETPDTKKQAVLISQSWSASNDRAKGDKKKFADYLEKVQKSNVDKKSKQKDSAAASKASSEAYKKNAEEVMKSNDAVRSEIDANLAKGLDPFGNKIPDGWEAVKNESQLTPGPSLISGDKEYVTKNIEKHKGVSYTKTEQGAEGNLYHTEDGGFTGSYGEKEFADWDAADSAFDSFVESDVNARRDEALAFIDKYDESGKARELFESGASGEDVLAELDNNSKWKSAKDDYDTRNFVDLPQKAQKDKWAAFGKGLKSIEDAPDKFEPVEKVEVKAVIPDAEPTPQAVPVSAPQVPPTPEAAPEPEWDVPDGAFKLFKPEEYEPEGRIDEESPDFTDDPKVLANKFGKNELISALAEAVRGEKNYDDADIDEMLDGLGEQGKAGAKKKTTAKAKQGTGFGGLEFSFGEEMVPAESLHGALREQGEDADMILAELYDMGTGESKNVDILDSARTGETVGEVEGPQIVDDFDEDDEIFDEVEEIIALNKWLAKPEIAQYAAVQLQAAVDNGESNPEIVKMASLITALDTDADVGALLAVNIEMAFSDNPDERQAFRGLFGVLLSTDGGYTKKGWQSMLSNAVADALFEYNGSTPSQGEIDDFFAEFGYYTDLLNGKEQIATGEVDIFNNDTTATAMYRLIAALTKPNVSKLYRGIQLDPDSEELQAYINEGGFISIDPRSFTTDKTTAGNFSGVFSKNTDKAAVIFTIPQGKGNSVDISNISLYELEAEALGWGNYKIVSVKEGTTPEGKTRYNVELSKVNDRDAVLEGYKDDYAPLLLINEDVDMPGEYYQLSTDAYTPGNMEGMPDEFDDSPLYIARMWEMESLLEVFRGGVEDGSGLAVLEYPIEDGFDAQISVEAIRDALQIQGIETNQVLKDIADVEGEPETSEPIDEPVPSIIESKSSEIAIQVSDIKDISDWEKKTGALGSNEGGFYEDPDGNRYYVKKAKSQGHAENEALASALYRLAGIDAAEVYIGKDGGDYYTYSPDIKNSKQDLKSRLNDPEYRKKLQEGFAVDAWLANWDVGGLVYDNVMTDGEGKPVRVDPGGALLFRAQGAPKGSAFGDEVNELDTFVDPSMNAVSADIFGDMSDEDKKASAERLLDISHEDIDKMVDATFSNTVVGDDLKALLKARRQFILEKFGLQGENTGTIADNTKVADEDADEIVVEETEPIDLETPEVESDSGNPYKTGSGTPITIGMQVVHSKTKEVGTVIKYDKGNPNYVFVQVGNEKPKNKSTKQLEEFTGGETLVPENAPESPIPVIEPEPIVENAPDAEPSPDKPEPGSSGNVIDIDVDGDVRAQVEAAVDKGDKIRFFYKGKLREVIPQSVWDNPKNGNINMYGEDLGDGQKKNFTIANFEKLPEEQAPEPESAVPEVDINGPMTDETRNKIIELLDKKDISSGVEVFVNAVSNPYTTEGEGLEVIKNMTSLSDVDSNGLMTSEEYKKLDAEYKKKDWSDNSGLQALIMKNLYKTGSSKQDAQEIESQLAEVPNKERATALDDEDTPSPEPEDSNATVAENLSTNLIYSGVEITDKKGKTGTVKKVNKDNYAFVEFEDGSTGWRSVATLSTTGNVKPGSVPPPPGATSSVSTPKPKAGKVTPAGTQVVVVENPDSWETSNFTDVPSLVDAIGQVKQESATGRNTAAMRGSSAAIDSDSIEDLDVRVMRVRNAQGEDGLRFKFKLTAWAGNAKAKSLLALDKTQANALGITRTSSMVVERINVGPDGIGQISMTETSYQASGGYSWKITTEDGIVINFNRGNRTGGSGVPKGEGGQAFHNTVEIQAPADATPEQIQKALEQAGVADTRPATTRDARILIENRLMSVFDSKTDATKNPSGEERAQSLQRIQDKYGITPDDVVISTGASGRIETKLSPEGAQKIVNATGNPEAIQHNLSVPYLGGQGVTTEDWIANLLANPQGGLLSTTTRWTEGIGTSGMSSHTDVATGGADYVFTKPVKNASAKEFGTGGYMFYFNPEKMYQRLDFYANYSDSYGARKLDQDIIKAAQTGAYELMFKHRVSFDDLDVFIVPSQAERTIIIQKLRQMGITEIGGRPLEAAISAGTSKDLPVPTA
jgi:hypothetical protein